MLHTKEKAYALRAIFELARQTSEPPLKCALIAEAQQIPRSFLEQIMGKLKQGGLITSKRGLKGGYSLSRPPEDIMVSEIFDILDESDVDIECLVCGSDTPCRLMGQCPYKPLWQKVIDAIRSVLSDTSIQDLIEYEKNAKTTI